MNEKNSISDYEIDLFEIFQIFWNGKWKIVIFVVVSLISVFIIKQFQPPPTFTAISEVKPITSAESNIYESLNKFGLLKVTKPLLLDLFIEKLNEKKIFEQIMEENSLIDFEKYNDEIIYKQEIRKLASTIKINKPYKRDDTSNFNWTIEFDFTDEKKWKKTLRKVDSSINLLIKNELQQKVNSLLLVANQERNFAIQDIEIQISNAIKDNDTETFNRIEFLTEQAKIARKLEIPKNTIDFQSYSGVLTNFNRDTPYYLNGYESIEMEIELMNSRTNKEAFVKILLSLEKEKRRLIQDKTIERAMEISNAAFDNNNFSAASINTDATVIKSQNFNILFIITALISGMISALYVLISTLSKRQK
tara:strand:- start:245 stop:1333 length:1089 start_codon:yes stop_codon:yes gene_type:complete